MEGFPKIASLNLVKRDVDVMKVTGSIGHRTFGGRTTNFIRAYPKIDSMSALRIVEIGHPNFWSGRSLLLKN